VYDVNYGLDFHKRKTQYVVLLLDGSYICTCLLLQNSGIVCRHFFHLMQVDSRFKYHIKLIPSRWYKESVQDDPDYDACNEPFVLALAQNVDGTETTDIPTDTYMSDILSAFPLTPTFSPDDQTRHSKRRKYAELSGQFKEVHQVLEANPEMFEMVQESLNKIIIEGRGVEGILDPALVKPKGKQKKSRTKSCVEVRSRSSTKCGVCNELGHNARRHHGLQKELT
jgi:hypothetical protein